MTYQVLIDWSANGLGCSILPKSKISEGIKKTLITKRSKPITIFFEAKWQPSQKKIKSFVKHLKTNSEKIYSGNVWIKALVVFHRFKTGTGGWVDKIRTFLMSTREVIFP